MDIPVIIEWIDHHSQRYDTCGDWQEIASAPRDGYEAQIAPAAHYLISVSRTKNWRSSMAVAVHELVEMALCIDRCISQASVDTFDMNWERHKDVSPFDEPGDDPAAPYYGPHQLATTVERILVEAFGLTWHDHTENLAALGPCPPDVKVLSR